MSISRRRFLETAALSSLAASAAEVDKKTPLPTRTLGKTGAKVSILAFGSGSRFLMYKEEDKALEALTRALDRGITYVDTAYSYGNGVSETRVGKVLKDRRKGIWLATKVQARKGDEAKRIIEGSLKRLQTDQVDLLHIHALMDAKDLADIEAADGVLKVLYQMRDQKMARFIGVTCHADPAVLKTALERHDFDCTQMALNAARAGAVSGRGGMAMGDSRGENSFEALALPVARRKKMGITAMKVFAQEGLVGKAPIEKLMAYSMSLPVASCVVGMPKLEFIDTNIQLAKSFKALSKTEMRDFSSAIASQNKVALDGYFQNHIDA